MRVVVGRAKHLAARQVLEHRGNAPPDLHRRRVNRQRMREARQRRAVGSQQECSLDQIALRLLHRQRGKFLVVQRTFAHRAIDTAAELTLDLRQRQLRDRLITTPLLGQPGVCIVDRLLATLDRDIGHRQASSIDTLRGNAVSVVPAHRMISTPRGYSAWLRCQTAAKSAGRPPIASRVGSRRPGPDKR